MKGTGAAISAASGKVGALIALACVKVAKGVE